MSWLHALILGLIQGCTEFFPISSSTHLKMVQAWLHIPPGEETLFFDLACHLGTLIALVTYFRKDVWDVIHQPRKLFLYFIALLPLIPAYFLLKPVRLWASHPRRLGACLLVTAVFLFVNQRIIKNPSKIPGWKDSLCIGAMQCLALVPGISRSASTISAGVWRGLSCKEAVRFSFLLSIPAVAGGSVLEILKVGPHALPAFDLVTCAIGLAVSALVGLSTVRVAIPLLERGVFRPFAWYCLIVAVLITVG